MIKPAESPPPRLFRGGGALLHCLRAILTMGDPPKSPEGAKRGWVAPFATRLCVIAWAAAVLTEVLPPSGFESLCILVGSQAAALGIVACFIVWLRFRQALLFLLLIATLAPGAYFVIVLRQIARLRGWNV